MKVFLQLNIKKKEQIFLKKRKRNVSRNIKRITGIGKIEESKNKRLDVSLGLGDKTVKIIFLFFF